MSRANFFVPVLTEQEQHRSIAEIRLFISYILGTLSTVLLIITLLAILFAPHIIKLFAPGFGYHRSRYLLATHMLRLTFPYILFISLTAVFAAILNTKHIFAIPACTPIIMNICLIFFAYWIAPHLSIPIIALSWGVLCAGILQFIFLMPFVYQQKRLTLPRLNFKNHYVKQVLKLMLPALFASSISQVNLLIDNVFTSFLAMGSISWLYYSERLMMFPLGVFGVAIATVILPHLSKHQASAHQHQFNLTLDWALRLLLLVGCPATIGLLILSIPIVSTLFQYQAFSAHDVLMTQQSLIAFSLGLPAFMTTKILATGFYANKNVKTPAKIAIIAMISNIFLNILFIFPLKHAGVALATSSSGIINNILLWYLLRRKKIYCPQKGWLIDILRLMIANTLLAIILWLAKSPTSIWIEQSGCWRITHLMMLMSTGILCYGIILWLLGYKMKQLYHQTP